MELNDCVNKDCPYHNLLHVHIIIEPIIDNDGFELLHHALINGGIDRFKITQNGDLILKDLEGLNVNFIPNYAACITKG